MEMSLLSPTRLLLPSDDEEVRRFLTFHDRSVDYQIKKMKDNVRWKMGDPDSYYHRLEELKLSAKKCLVFYDDESRPYTYSGLWNDLQNRFGWSFNQMFPDIAALSIPWTHASPEMYYYQKEAVDRLLQARHGGVELPTGSGKTLIALNLSKNLPLNTIIVTPSSAITDQLYKEYVKCFGIRRTGKYGDGSKQCDKLFTVATAQALTRLRPSDEAYSQLTQSKVLLFDECFPYDTKIITEYGSIRISTIYNMFYKRQPVPKVLSYNQYKQCFEYKTVLNAWKRTSVTDLVKIKMRHKSFVCTRNHKILTDVGWLEAGRVLPGMYLIGNRNDQRSSFAIRYSGDAEQYIIGSYLGDGSITFHNNGIRLRVIHGESQLDYLKFGAYLVGSSNIEMIPCNGYSQKKAYRFQTKEFITDLPFQQRKNRLDQRVLDKMDARGLAIWFMDDGSYNGKIYTNSFDYESHLKIRQWFADRWNLRVDIKIERQRYYSIYVPAHEFRRFSSIIAPYMHRSLSYKLHKAYRNKCGQYQWKPFCDETGYRCVTDVEGYTFNLSSRRAHLANLYDIEVQDNHNFVVGNGYSGIVAHNCHTTPATTFEQVCMGLASNIPYRFFFSATQMRNDGSEMVLRGITGPIVYRKPFRELVDEGFLARMVFKTFTVPSYGSTGHPDPKTETRSQLYENPNVNRLAADIANKSVILANRQTVIIIEEFKQFLQLKNFLTVPYEFVHGGASQDIKRILPQMYWKSNTDEVIDSFNAGRTKLLIGTSAISTGVDLKPVQCLIYLQGGTSEIKVRQSIGRGTRLTPGKADCWVIDFKVRGSRTMERHYALRKKIYESIDTVTEYE